MELSDIVKSGGIVKRESLDKYVLEAGLLPSEAVSLEKGIDVEPLVVECPDESPYEDLTSIKLFRKEAKKIPLLTAAEERSLSFLVHNAPDEFTRLEARNELVRHNLLFALWMAEKFKSKVSSSFGMEDLLQECNQGLIYAAEMYDGTKGVRFCNYAYYCVLTYVSRAVADIAYAFKVPRAFPARYAHLKTAEDIVKEKHNGVASIPDIVKEHNKMFPSDKVTVQYAEEIFSLSPSALSLELPIGEAGNQRYDMLKDTIEDTAPTAADRTEADMAKAVLYELMDAVLNDREKMILKARYRLSTDADGEETFRIIGERFGISPQRANKICKDAEGKLGHALRQINFETNMLGV